MAEADWTGSVCAECGVLVDKQGNCSHPNHFGLLQPRKGQDPQWVEVESKGRIAEIDKGVYDLSIMVSCGSVGDKYEILLQAIREAREQGAFEAYEKARELVGFSPNASHVIEAQMQQEFPDRAFVPSTQQRAGSRMDGSNMRMPKAPEQFREEGRVEMREKCRETASGLRKVASGKETNYGKGMAQAALLIEDAISRIATSS